MDEIDAMLDALWNAAVSGDTEAAVFLCTFGPWAMERLDLTSACSARDRVDLSRPNV